jgi:uncharacterized membrane protein YbhN (UPF0104 family)
VVSSRAAWLDRLIRKIGQGRQAALRTLRDPAFWVVYPVLTIASAVVSMFVTWVCFLALDRQIDLIGLLFLYLASSLLRHVAVTPGNLGFQEMMYGGGAKLLGLTLADGILVSMLIRASGALTLFSIAIPLGAGDAWRDIRDARHPDHHGR